MAINEHQYVTKMALCVTMGHLWGNFTIIFWIVDYLQRPIYIWNKISKCIMSKCGMNFQSILLYIVYNFQHFEEKRICYGLSRSSPIFQMNDPKVHIGLDDFPSLIMQKLQIQFSQLTTCFYWNENFDSTIIDILKNHWDSQWQYVVSLFNISCNTKFPINYEIFPSPSTLISKTKVQKIPKVQMEHFQDLIVDPNITQKKKKKKIDWAFFDNNIFELLDVYPNLTHSK
jgi:hypothetical protein